MERKVQAEYAPGSKAVNIESADFDQRVHEFVSEESGGYSVLHDSNGYLPDTANLAFSVFLEMQSFSAVLLMFRSRDSKTD